jgi:hypothetical protein
MNLMQFEAIATLISSREPTKSAARRVLVDRIENINAAREFQLSRQSVSNTVARFRAAEAAIASAFSCPQQYDAGTSSNVYNDRDEAARCELQSEKVQMSKFIRIDKSRNPEHAEFLNLDLVC